MGEVKKSEKKLTKNTPTRRVIKMANVWCNSISVLVYTLRRVGVEIGL